MEILTFKTGKEELLDITGEISRVIAESGAISGTCKAYVPHTTCALTINENADPSVKSDILAALRKTVPENLPYRHAEGNSAAHVKSSLLGCSVEVFVENGKPLLGTWQGIFLAEFDGPRTREVFVEVFGRKNAG